MANYKVKLNPFNNQLQLVLDESSIDVLHFKPGVATVGDLPSSGNTKNDARIVNDTHHLYVWDGAAWQDQGDIIDIDWSALTGKPSSSVADIDDAVSKKHAQGTDSGTRSATKIVAANDSVDKLKADYLCDGTTDETEIIAAINAIDTAGGGRVILLEGTYNLTNFVSFSEKNNVILEGQGIGTILEITVDQRAIYMINCNNNTIRNLKISSTSTSYPCIDMAINASNNIIENIFIFGGKQGIRINSSTSSKNIIKNNRIENTTEAGIKLEDETLENIIQNNFVISCEYGMILGQADKCSIKNNIIKDSNQTGIVCSILTNSQVIGNISEENGLNGIEIINASRDNIISNNIVCFNQEHGIYIYWWWSGISNTHNIISNNKLHNNSQVGNNAKDEIHVREYSEKNIIVGNSIRCDGTNKARYGIYEKNHATIDYNLILGNFSEGAVTGEILVQGANSEKAHNIEI